MKIDFPIAYVDLIADCLQVIQSHNLHDLLSTDHSPSGLAAIKQDIDSVLHHIVDPLQLIDNDATIVVKKFVVTYEIYSEMTDITHVFYCDNIKTLIEHISMCDDLFGQESSQDTIAHLDKLQELGIHYTNTEIIDQDTSLSENLRMECIMRQKRRI